MSRTYTLSLVPETGRFDKALAAALAVHNVSRAQVQRAIKAGEVTDEAGNPVRDWSSLDSITLHITIETPPMSEKLVPEAIDLDVVYEDEHVLVINKRAGLVVHPGAGNWSGTLVNGLISYLGDDLQGVGDDSRPGLVHRLDKDTTGVMVIAKTEEARLHLSRQLADRSMSRTYEALCWGAPPLPHMSFDGPIGRHLKNRQMMAVTAKGREAVTHIERRATLAGGAVTLLDCRLETGRTHQIRVHLSHAGFPLVGDPFYGLVITAARARCKRLNLTPEQTEALLTFPRQALHARRLEFIHPETEEDLAFEAPRPDDLQTLYNLFMKIS